jgi:phosphatidylglycerophosphate synthase
VIDAGLETPLETPKGQLPGTAVRDSTTAITTSVVLCTLLSILQGFDLTSWIGAAVGVALVAVAGAAVMSRTDRWSGPADRVTLGRTVLIGGCAALAVPLLAGTLPARYWWLTALMVPALLLDFVDGLVARRTGTSSQAGARFDMEMDAALLLVLSLVAVRSLGWWVLAIGAMRYAYVAAGHFRPQLRKPLPFSQFRRVVAAVQGMMLAIGLAPVVPLTAGRCAVAVALILLVISFGRDVISLELGVRAAGNRRAETRSWAPHPARP